jgi:ATP-binding cassette subfamily F protein uup
MNYLTLENITKSYGEKVLFKDLTMHINKGDKVALIAKNGTGKSSLMNIITGKDSSEGHFAKVIVAKDIRMGFLDQDPDLNDRQTVFEEVLSMDNAHVQAVKAYLSAMENPDDLSGIEAASMKMDELKAWDQEARIREILSKLKVDRLQAQVGHLSGGQRKRLALAKLLIDAPDFLILDEPTNHLDLDMIEWLEEYLQRPNLTLLMVTHDRYFLECICDQIVELEYGVLTKFSGNYSDYLEKKALLRENESIELEKTKKLFRKELDWVRRQPKARTTKAKSRVDKFEEIKEKAFSGKIEDELKIEIKTQRLGSKILEAHNLSKAYDNLKIVDQFNYKFRKGERVGIVGPNGTGKSTFLNMLTGKLPSDSGKLVIGDNTEFGYYTQEGIQLSEDKRVIDVITDIAEYIPLEKGKSLTAASLLEKFLFPRSQQQVYVSQLSGGEKRRLYLLTVLMKNPNFLILDEPTNDLDIMTLQVLEDYLLDFPGCLMIVSHDRYFLDKLVEHLFVLEGNGTVTDFNGNYTQYRMHQLQLTKARQEQTQKTIDIIKESDQGAIGLSHKERKELHNLEKEIEKLECRKKEILQLFNDSNQSADQLGKLSEELGILQEKLEEKELRWLELEELKQM